MAAKHGLKIQQSHVRYVFVALTAAQHCSSLCSQSEGDDFLGGARGATTNIFRYVFVALTLRAK